MQLSCASLAEYQAKARQVLAPEIWHYLDSGSEAGRTQRQNEIAFERITLCPRPLADVRGGHTRTTLFGQTLTHPFLLAPVAYQRLFHPDGEVGSAMAAEAQQTTMIVSSLASQSLSEIAATRASLWFQLYWQSGREATLRLLRRAEDAGARAVVFTVDAPVKQASITLPPGVRAVNLDSAALLPAITDGQSEVFDQWMRLAPQWDDLVWLRSQTRLPLLVKGLLHPDDAARAIDAGCDGLIVSNHGGRVLDSTPTSLQTLRCFRRRFGPSLPLLFDSGLRSGSDAFKAIALGADAVLAGRPAIWGLAVSGPLGVAHVLKLLRDALEMTMALMGCPDIASISGSCEPLSDEDDSQ
jgi:4-hydroxymandelate oxidase